MKLTPQIQIEIQGEKKDAYYANAAQHFEELAPLIAYVRMLPDDITIFDVGANIGLSTIALAVEKPRAKIVAFEPSPINFVHLQRNVARFPNVEAIQMAVSDTVGTLRFADTEFAAGSHIASDRHIGSGWPTVAVEATSLDAFAKKRKVSPNFIKIDVEGHEPEVLAGARDVLRGSRPAICMEFNSWTLMANADHNPIVFARSLFSRFDVEGHTDPTAFLYINMTEDRCVSDIIFRLREGAEPPSLSEFMK